MSPGSCICWILKECSFVQIIFVMYDFACLNQVTTVSPVYQGWQFQFVELSFFFRASNGWVFFPAFDRASLPQINNGPPLTGQSVQRLQIFAIFASCHDSWLLGILKVIKAYLTNTFASTEQAYIPVEKIIRTSMQSASTSWQCNTSGNHHQPATYGDLCLKWYQWALYSLCFCWWVPGLWRHYTGKLYAYIYAWLKYVCTSEIFQFNGQIE